MAKKSEFSPHSHVPYGKDGSGYYSDNTLGIWHVMQEGLPLVLDALKSISVQSGSVFTIVDYGTADGGTSMSLLYECVKAIREKYGEELPINIIYEDQPVNDFKSVFMRLQGLIPGPPSFFKDFSNVFVMACGTNFYEQCVPSNTVHLGFSSTCMHWLSKKPCDITDTLHHTMMTDLNERETFQKQAEKDWELLLLQRAKELVPGGFMVLIQFTVDEHGQYLGRTDGTKVSMFQQMHDIWRGLVAEGRITEEEFKHMTFINYYRTVEEYKKPFKDPDSPVCQKGLELVSIETRVVRCPYKQKWMKEKGDPKEHAKWYNTTHRSWSNFTFLSGLSDSRSAEEKADIVDEFFNRYETEVAKNPDNHGVDYVHAYMVVRKRQ